MCYSAQIWSDYRKYVRAYGADIDLATFTELFWSRLDNDKIKVPLALEHAFEPPQGTQETHIQGLINRYRLQQAAKLEQELFKQRQRLADAQRTLLTKTTKAALEARRISSTKIEWVKSMLADLRRTEMRDSDSRIYPGYCAPVMIVENGRRVVKPMRYQCRPAGKPAIHDSKFPGTYNARRDNLEGFWRRQFGHTHGLMVVNAFYEHVVLPQKSATGMTVDGKVEKVILEFKPRPAQDMLVACIWSHWTGAGEPDLYSIAAITDEPPSEVAAAPRARMTCYIYPC